MSGEGWLTFPHENNGESSFLGEIHWIYPTTQDGEQWQKPSGFW